MNYKLSYWTLRLNDIATNEEYLNCQRQEVQTNAKYMLIAHAIVVGILLMFLYAFLDAKDGTQERLGFMVGAVLPPTICLTIMYKIARYKPVFLDLLGLAYFTGYIVAHVALSY